MSFHGLPEKHIRRSDRSRHGHCLARPACCSVIGEANRDCYLAQCYATARGLAERLDFDANRWEVAFQSRMGRSPWVQPFTDQRVRELAADHCRRLAVVCPAFVADCVETLEEIGVRARNEFRALGGDDLRLVPALNSDPAWVAAIAGLCANTASHR